MTNLRKRLFTRRTFLRALGASTLAGVAAYAYGSTIETRRLVVQHVTIPIPGLAARWHNCRLVQLSDLHIGRASLTHNDNALKLALSLKPDFLLITGDFIDSNKTDLAQVGKLLAPAAAQVPTLGCTGNHDFAQRLHDPVFIERVCDTLGAAGVRMLRNQVFLPGHQHSAKEPASTFIDADAKQTPGDLCFAGVEDLWAGKLNPAALDLAPADASVILLYHNPDSYELLADKRWHLMLCGHTHGGQVCIPFFGPLILPIQHRERHAGLFHLDPAQPHRALYVNRGIGHLLKIRLFCPPEITCFTLKNPAIA